jgi:hypothetical protein
MASRDLTGRLSPALSLAPAARTTSANGTGVDLQGYESATVLFIAGTITDGTHTPKLQESDDNSTFSDVAAEKLIGSFSAVTSSSGGNSVQEVGYLGGKRYIRVAVTVSGSPSTGGVYGAVIVCGNPRSMPA